MSSNSSGDAPLSVAFLDVGQADCTVVVLPCPKPQSDVFAVLVDCPSDTGPAYDYMRRAGVTHVTDVLVTHSDQDHIAGTGELIDNCRAIGIGVGRLAYLHDTSAIAHQKRRRAILRHLLQTARRAGIRTVSPSTGQRWAPAADVIIEILHPDDEDLKQAQLDGSPNDASILVKMSYAGRHVLVTGDLGGKGWARVIQRGTNLSADFLRFPHHGAWYDPAAGEPSLPDVLAKIDPEVVVFSVGTTNGYGHPDLRSVQLLDSMPKVRFAHTQQTPRCFVDGKATPWPRQFSVNGSVEIVVKSTNYGLAILDKSGSRKMVP